MTEQPPSGSWAADPTQRFGQRWFDGSRWTEHVLGAAGQPVVDALPADAQFAPPTPAPPAPPPAPQQYAPQEPAPQQYAPQQYAGHGYGPPPSQDRFGPGFGLAIGAVGVIAVVLSLFVLKWFDADQGSFLDLSSRARDVDSSQLDGLSATLAWAWDAWAGFVLFGLTVVVVVLAGVPLPGTRGAQQTWRIVGALVAGAAAVLQANAFAGVPGDALEPGAWIGVVGFVLVGVGMVAGPRRLLR